MHTQTQVQTHTHAHAYVCAYVCVHMRMYLKLSYYKILMLIINIDQCSLIRQSPMFDDCTIREYQYTIIK